MLNVNGIHTFYGLSHILFDFTLTVSADEIVGLLGRNGAGKSTTMRSIMGLTPPRTGTITFKGEPITGKNAYLLVGQGIAYVPDDRRVFADLSVDDNLELAFQRKDDWNKERVYGLFPALTPRSPKEARTPSNPLSPATLADLLLRHTSANHKRETIAFSKRRQSAADRLWLLLGWRNYVKSVSERKRDATPAMRQGRRVLTALVVEGVKFQNAPWGSRPDMAQIKRFEIQVALLPLISGNIELSRLILMEPDILVETDRGGKSNLEFEKKLVAEKPKDAPPTKGEMKLPALAIKELSSARSR